MEVAFEAGSVLCKITPYLAPIFRGRGGEIILTEFPARLHNKSIKEVIVSLKLSLFLQIYQGECTRARASSVETASREKRGRQSLLPRASSHTRSHVFSRSKKGRPLVVCPIVQFDPTRTQSDDRSPNGWMNGGKGFKVLALVVKSVLCCRSCFLCAIDVPRRTLF